MDTDGRAHHLFAAAAARWEQPYKVEKMGKDCQSLMAREITSQVVEKCGIGFLYVLANNFEPMPTNNALDHYLLAGERWTPAGSSVGSSVEVEASIYGLRGREEGSGSRRGCGGSGCSGVLKRIGGTPTTARTVRDMLKEADAGGRWEGEGRAVGGGHASPSAPP